MTREMPKVVLSERQIRTRVRQMGEQISRDYSDTPFVAVCILKGAVVFLSDLCRSVEAKMEFDFMAVSSYGSATESSGEVRILKDLDESIENKHVLLVEDIVDTGLTLRYLTGVLKGRRPASLKVCCLLDKPSRRQVPVEIEYCGFCVPGLFLVGYGLDYAGEYRNLPYIGSLDQQ